MGMNRSRPTVADLRANRGKRMMSMLHIEDLDEARASAAAGIDILSIEEPIWNGEMREAAGDCFVQVGLLPGLNATTDDYLRKAHWAIAEGGDCCYCAAATGVVERLANEGFPIVGHVGLVPSKRTWTGGFKAVGKTIETAKLVWNQVKDLENAGAFAVELEVVPERISAEIFKRTSVLLFSMGGGAHADAQYLFSTDVLGYSDWWTPRHSKTYRDFRTEFERLQNERVAAFREFKADCESSVYPQDEHKVPVSDEVVAEFIEFVDSHG